MRFNTIRKCGKIGFEFKKGVNGKTRKFIRALVVQVAKNCVNYYEQTGDHLFSYRERQFNSAVCPAISEISNCFIIQHPLKRKARGEEPYTGRLDYWVNYDNIDFLIELKHDYYGYYNSKWTPWKIEMSLNSAIEQLKKIGIKELRKISIAKRVVKLALSTVVFYIGSSQSINIDKKVDEKNIKNSFKNLLEGLNSNSLLGKNVTNVQALWILHKNLLEEYEYQGRFQIYPAVSYVGHAFEVITL
jgi:hypothetical protein